ncbi:MAG: dihydrofolate reductase [Pseudomonadales bacterium]
MSRNRVIGRDNDLPWHLPKDMRFFMVTTRGHPVIMGRRTFESMSGPLPGRTNIVVTRNTRYHPEGVLVAADLDAAIALAEAQCAADGIDEFFIAGGAELYRAGLERATRLYVTEVDADVAGDTFFPEFDRSVWATVRSEQHPADDRHAYPFRISVLERLPAASA